MSFGFNARKLMEPNIWTNVGLLIVFMFFFGVFKVDPLTIFDLSPLTNLVVRLAFLLIMAGTLWYLITRLGTINGKPIWKKFT